MLYFLICILKSMESKILSMLLLFAKQGANAYDDRNFPLNLKPNLLLFFLFLCFIETKILPMFFHKFFMVTRLDESALV